MNSERKLVYNKDLKADLVNIRDNYLAQEQSWIMPVTGRIGIGKSYFAMQICKYIDPTFNLDRICFTPEKFRECLQLYKQKAILFDEAIIGLYAGDFMTSINRDLSKAMIMSRKYSNFIVLAIPNMRRLDKSVREDLVSSLINIKMANQMNGKHRVRYFKFYSRQRLNKILNNFPVRCNYKGNFPNYNPFGKEYDKLKDKSINDFFSKLEKKEKGVRSFKEQKDIRNEVIQKLYESKKVTQKDIGKLYNLTRESISKIIKRVVTRNSVNDSDI